MNEIPFIEALRSLPLHPGSRGLADDAAVVNMGGETIILTHDTLVEGVHVREDEDAADTAWKLVAVNLSDLAAKGAKPLGVLVSHMLGGDDTRFIYGLREVLGAYDVSLLGGDTVRAEGRRVWGCTAIGTATHAPVPARSGAKPGDVLYIGGRIGEAMLGLEALRNGSGDDSLAYRRPRPQLELGRRLAPQVTAMMDVSDGLLLDAARMADASGRTIAIDAALVAPLAPPGRLDDAMRWGDDYVLLAAGPEGLDREHGVTRIGTIETRGEHSVLLDNAPPEGSLGYTHG